MDLFLELLDLSSTSSLSSSSLLRQFIQIDSRMGNLNNHLDLIFSHIRRHAVSAVQTKSPAMLSLALSMLQQLLSVDEACAVFGATQTFMKAEENAIQRLLAVQADYLAPFFDLHPTEFIGGVRIVQPDLSTPQSIQGMSQQFTSLMEEVKMLNVMDGREIEA